jgi:hypothetical protein
VPEISPQSYDIQYETAQQLARTLGLSLGWVRKHTLLGLPHLKCGKATRYQLHEVVEYLRAKQGK